MAHLCLNDAYLLSEVVQCSVLGLLMFIIFINELTGFLSKFGISAKCFADDAKLYSRIIMTSVFTCTLYSRLSMLSCIGLPL